MLALAFVSGLLGTGLTLMVASRGAALADARLPSAAALSLAVALFQPPVGVANAPPGFVPGRYARRCPPGIRGPCPPGYIPPRFQPSFDSPTGRDRGATGMPLQSQPDGLPRTPHANEPQSTSPNTGIMSGGGGASFGSGYFDLPRPPDQ